MAANKKILWIIIACIAFTGLAVGGVLFFLSVQEENKALVQYLSLSIWAKEEEALSLMKTIPEQAEFKDYKERLSRAAGLFGEIETQIKGLSLKHNKLLKLNTLQLDICRIYRETADTFKASKDFNTDILYGLREADVKLKEFLKRCR